MSDIKDLQKKAMEIRKKYEEFEKKQDGSARSVEDLSKDFQKDVNDLLDMMSGHKAKQPLERELADCLTSVLVISYKLGIDIERAFWRTMGEHDLRLDKELS